MTPLKIEYVPIEQLKPFEGNPRKNDESVDAVVKSIEAFGYTNPILARKANNEIIAGHTRLKALQQLGAKQAPVIFLDLNETDARVYSVFDNKSVENADWDFPKLADLLVEFDQLNVDLDLTGFNADEIEDIAPETFGPPQRDDDDVIPESPPPVCKTGDLWILGQHRLLCGDCTTQANVERLMGNQKADMVLADPPYNVGYIGGSSNKEERKDSYSDKWTDTDYSEWLSKALSCAFIISSETAALHLWFAGNQMKSVINAFEKANWQLRNLLIWNKLKAHYGALGAQYKERKEPMWYCHKKGKAPLWYGATNECTVWDVEQPHKNELHPTMKPVELYERSLKNHSQKGSCVIELFLGSGTTLIACEKLNRRCYGMEIEPKYCDVIIKRWEDYTGGKAVLDENRP
jgi:site-specific DNA-methyltransferase (adenine-specific)